MASEDIRYCSCSPSRDAARLTHRPAPPRPALPCLAQSYVPLDHWFGTYAGSEADFVEKFGGGAVSAKKASKARKAE